MATTAAPSQECTKLRSCGDCQDPANTKFCGWCADGRYCLPKHVHKGLVRSGKGCAQWHEDTCPARKPVPGGNRTGTSGLDANGDSLAEEWGDDRSVALAEALVAIIDREMGEGASSWVGFFLLLGGIALVLLCTLREKRANERRKRYEKFMEDETENLRQANHPFVCGSPRGQLGLRTPMSNHLRRLGPDPEAGGGGGEVIMTATGPRDPRARALAEAMGGAMSPQAMEREENGSASSVVLDASQRVKDDAAKAEAEAKAVRDAARRDIEERKEHRRRMAEQTRVQADAAERQKAEEKAKLDLQAAARALKATTEEAPKKEVVVAPVASPPKPAPSAAPAVAPAAAAAAGGNLAAAEAEFLAALDDI